MSWASSVGVGVGVGDGNGNGNGNGNVVAVDDKISAPGDQDCDEGEGESRPLVSLFHCSGRLGAAAYSPLSASLCVLSDLDDLTPGFGITKSLLAQLDPALVLLSNRQSNEFVSVVKNACGNDEDNSAQADDCEETRDSACSPKSQTTTLTRDPALVDSIVNSLPGKDFSYEAGRRRILSLRLPGNADKQITDEDNFILISGLVDLDSTCCVRATGALLKHLDTHSVQEEDEGGNVPSSLIVSIRPLMVEKVLSLDQTAFSALQIFSRDWQPTSGSRAGSWNKSREGLSLFRLLCRGISSPALGARYLRHLCRCPSGDPSVIEARLTCVAFFRRSANVGLATVLRDFLRRVGNVPAILKRLAAAQATVKDWKRLRRSLEGLMAICEVCQHHSTEEEEWLGSISAEEDLKAVLQYLNRVFDEEASEHRSRFTVNAGVDATLDEKRRVHNGLPDLLLKVAEEEIVDLPHFMTECSTVYVPQIGYMLSVQPWTEEELTHEQLLRLEEEADLRFMFVAGGVPHFKTRRCTEMDAMLGDTATVIAEHETAVMVRLTSLILASADKLLNLCKKVALLDCLLAFAQVASERGWCRPEVTNEDALEIRGGRHPLLEQASEGDRSFVANPTRMGADGSGESRTIVLTGLNACGKSVYLKQVGLIVFLSHLGSFVPADSARVPIFAHLRTRITTLDSLSIGLSAFAVDLNQMSAAFRCRSTSRLRDRSLLLVDEFGKGTAERDGRALLAACVEAFAREKNKPYSIICTHFHGLRNLLPAELAITYCTFDYVLDAGSVIFLYKLKEVDAVGTGGCSRALATANRVGIPRRIVERAAEVLDCLLSGSSVLPREDVYPAEEAEKLVEHFFEDDLDDPEKFLRKFKRANPDLVILRNLE